MRSPHNFHYKDFANIPELLTLFFKAYFKDALRYSIKQWQVPRLCYIKIALHFSNQRIFFENKMYFDYLFPALSTASTEGKRLHFPGGINNL